MRNLRKEGPTLLERAYKIAYIREYRRFMRFLKDFGGYFKDIISLPFKTNKIELEDSIKYEIIYDEVTGKSVINSIRTIQDETGKRLVFTTYR